MYCGKVLWFSRITVKRTKYFDGDGVHTSMDGKLQIACKCNQKNKTGQIGQIGPNAQCLAEKFWYSGFLVLSFEELYTLMVCKCINLWI